MRDIRFDCFESFLVLSKFFGQGSGAEGSISILIEIADEAQSTRTTSAVD
jgi:hypothetical protein